jgi:peptidoglycan/LPS O-acetylase OafA/YrhL
VFWLVCPFLVTWQVFARHIPYSAGLEGTVSSLLMVVLLNWFLHNDQSWLGRALQTTPVLMLGKLSYSLYLWQQLFLGPKNRAAERDKGVSGESRPHFIIRGRFVLPC